MSTQLALNQATYDLYKPSGGGVSRVEKGRFTVQLVQSKLRTILQEWILDSTIGWINQNDFEKNYSIYDIEDRARRIILSTRGVLSIISMHSLYSQRVLTLQFTADTMYGEIDLTIPWDNANQPI